MSWWIVTTAPSLERRAVAGLGEAGFLAWTPMRLVVFKTRHMPYSSSREYPAFPGYAFVSLLGFAEPEEAWHRMRAVEEVRSILVNDGRPIAISDREFDSVRAHLDGIADKPVDIEVWRKDDLARISDVRSPFYGHVATVARGPRRGCVQVLLSLFGRETATEVPVESLERAA